VGNVDNVDGLASILGCRVSFFPLKYLALPFGASYNIKHQLASWERMYLSKDSRFTLIKSTLTNFPTYFMSLFPLLANREASLRFLI
jgi:hypothetical protein